MSSRLRLLIMGAVGTVLLALSVVAILFPRSAQDQFQEGMRASREQDYDRAIACYTAVLRREPENTKAYFARGYAHYENGAIEEAIADLTASIQRSPKNLYAYHYRALAYRELEKYDLALSDADRAIGLRPHAEFFIARGLIHNDRNEWDRAIADFDKAIETDPSHASEAYFQRGFAWKKKREYRKAIADYLKAIELTPSQYRPHENLAWLLATCPNDDMRNGQESLRHATKACELTHWEDASCLSTLAAAHAEVGNFQEAVKWQTKALESPEAFHESELSKERAALVLYRERKPRREE